MLSGKDHPAVAISVPTPGPVRSVGPCPEGICQPHRSLAFCPDISANRPRQPRAVKPCLTPPVGPGWHATCNFWQPSHPVGSNTQNESPLLWRRRRHGVRRHSHQRPPARLGLRSRLPFHPARRTKPARPHLRCPLISHLVPAICFCRPRYHIMSGVTEMPCTITDTAITEKVIEIRRTASSSGSPLLSAYIR